ncbi:hypothetical protein OCU04_009911 [Sclerotinia nivalis]|uniref:Uncharacterized protein n=1 Tax=Sclerotinia nivalis TaxID=352851 RepID=A0A9X0DGI2_9HELO|nr:hypothetical protein OCU04_009911 [Sclerotinia nivalis]
MTEPSSFPGNMAVIPSASSGALPAAPLADSSTPVTTTGMALRSGKSVGMAPNHSRKRKVTSTSEPSLTSKKTRTTDGASLTGDSGRDGIVEGGILKIDSKQATKMFITKSNKSQFAIPIEVFNEVLQITQERGDIATLICLGLTNKDLWGYAFNKKLITDETASNLPSSVKKTLASCLVQWMGPQYRPAGNAMLSFGEDHACNIMFLPRSFYGTTRDNEEETGLVARYKDVDRTYIPRRVEGGEAIYSRLPAPIGLGGEWYEYALNVIIEEAREWERDGDKDWVDCLDEFWLDYEWSELKKWVDSDYHEAEDSEDGHCGEHYELMRMKCELRELERSLSYYS